MQNKIVTSVIMSGKDKKIMRIFAAENNTSMSSLQRALAALIEDRPDMFKTYLSKSSSGKDF